MLIPAPSEIIVLITGNYLLVIIAVVIHFIKESYRRLVEKNNIEKQKHQTELKLKEAKLKLLQGQIHPHFLFNMLNNLYGMVNESVDDSRTIIMKLSDLLDYMLYECDKPYVKLEKEIKFIENYIELERIRHDENFNVSIDYSQINDKVVITPLILFPFVENAFKHGFNNPEKNYIKIKIELIGNDFKLEIINSLTDIKSDKYLNQEGKGIGLKNIRDRLNLIYKDKYKLNIVEKNDEFIVKLNLKLNESIG
jgi:LytS/YehU family sensor histidine kinase